MADPTTSEAAIPDEKPPARRVVRVLSSELEDEDLRESLNAFVREAIGNEVWLETLLPENALDGDLLRTAIDHHWDLGILVLDNIKYPSLERGDIVIIKGAGKLIRGMRQAFKQPLICFYNRIDDPELSKVALAAGADGVFRLPCKSADIVPTLKRCLNAFATPPPLPPSEVSPEPPSGPPAASPPLPTARTEDPPIKKPLNPLKINREDLE